MFLILCFIPSHKQDQEELFDKILRGDYEFLQPFWDDVSESAKVTTPVFLMRKLQGVCN